MKGHYYMYLCIQVHNQYGITSLIRKRRTHLTLPLLHIEPFLPQPTYGFSQLLHIILRRIHPSHYRAPSFEEVAADTNNSY